jgi:hypothetical protein
MHIIGMLKLITFCNFHVVHNCGKYCTQASNAAQIPSAVAQDCRSEGYQSSMTADVIRRAKKCRTQVSTTVSAVRQVGGEGASAGCGSGPGWGKNIKKRNILQQQFVSISFRFVILLCRENVHHSETSPLDEHLRQTQEAGETCEASVHATAGDVSLRDGQGDDVEEREGTGSGAKEHEPW